MKSVYMLGFIVAIIYAYSTGLLQTLPPFFQIGVVVGGYIGTVIGMSISEIELQEQT